MATKKEIYTKKSDGSLQFVGYLPTEDVVSASEYSEKVSNLDTRTTANENSISTLNTAVADRYTKAETDGRYAFNNDIQDTIRQASYSPENLYDINPFLFNNLANLIERGGSAEVYNSAGNRIKSSNEMISLFRFGSGTFTYIYATTNEDFVFDVIIKSPESYVYAGILSVYFPSYYDGLILKANAYWGYSSDGTPTTWNSFYNKTGEAALSHHGMYSWIQKNDFDKRNWFKIHFEINQAAQEVRLGLISYVPYDGAISYFLTRNGGTIYDKIQGSITNADHASVATTYTYACTKGTIFSTSFDSTNPFTDTIFEKNYVYHPHLVVARSADPFSPYFADSWSSGLFWNEGDTWAGFSVSNRDYNKKIRFVVGGIGGNGGNPAWTLDLITNDNISSQVVKSFTATEIDHGDKFNGDLSSTTCSSAPMMVTTGKITASSANEPNATKTTKTKEIRMGNTKKTVTCPMNPFMEYFFDHGYHFDNGEEGSGSQYDVGIVAYSNRIYYCVFRYVDEVDNDFTASPLETNDDTENSKFLFKTDGVATGLTLDDNQIKGGNNYTLKFPNKGGTIATTGDLPVITDSLTETRSGYVLSAKGGNTLQGHIDSIKFTSNYRYDNRIIIGAIGTTEARNDTNQTLVRATSISGGDYGAFYTIFALENGYNKDFGVIAVENGGQNGSGTISETRTSIVAMASGEKSYWGIQWLSISVLVPAGKKFQVYGARISSSYAFCTKLTH